MEACVFSVNSYTVLISEAYCKVCRKVLYIYPKCSINISYYFRLWAWRLFQHFPASAWLLKELVLSESLKNKTNEKTDFGFILTAPIYFPPGLSWNSPRPSSPPIFYRHLHPTSNSELLSSDFTYSSSALIYIPHGSDSRFYAAVKLHAHHCPVD